MSSGVVYCNHVGVRSLRDVLGSCSMMWPVQKSWSRLQVLEKFEKSINHKVVSFSVKRKYCIFVGLVWMQTACFIFLFFYFFWLSVVAKTVKCTDTSFQPSSHEICNSSQSSVPFLLGGKKTQKRYTHKHFWVFQRDASAVPLQKFMYFT